MINYGIFYVDLMKTFKNFTLRINKKLGSRLASGSFGHNVMLMFLGTAIGQMGSIILSPVLTRIYTPEDFGVLGIYMTVIFILSLIASLRYEIAIPLTRSEEETSNILAVCAFSLCLTSSVVGAFLYLNPQAPYYLQSSLGMLWPYRMLVPVGMFAIGLYQVLVGYATHRKNFKSISQTKVYQGYGGPVIQIILGLSGANIWGLISGFIVGQSMGVTMLFKKLMPQPRQIIQNISWQHMKDIAWRFRNFPLVSSFSVLVGTFSGDNLLLMVIPVLYDSATITGFIFFISRIVGRPIYMISTSILQVYMGDISKSRDADPKAMRKRFLNIVRFQFVIVSVWLALVNLTAEYLVPVIFGQQWAGCVPYIYILTIAYLPQMTLHAVSDTLQILEKQKLSACIDIFRLLLISSIFVWGYFYKIDVFHLLTVYCLVRASISVILFFIMYRSIQAMQRV